MPPRRSLASLPTLYPSCSPRVLSSHHQRNLSSVASQFQSLAQKPTSKYQIYSSRSTDPFVNLSIEHFLLQKTPAHSVVLFFYVDRPCVVLGRNQNPWLEADIRALNDDLPPLVWTSTGSTTRGPQARVDLVRRRSGGGAVFHDSGNVNYCVICPTEDFSRDKHAEVVVQAIRQDNPRARVNERHDIVLDQGDPDPDVLTPDPSNMHKTGYQANSHKPPLKVSGSAYKLTRTRALHHGTCLLNSPNLQNISQYLRSPARPYLKARGVDSVRSSVGNVYEIYRPNAATRFQRLVAEAFVSHYRLERECLDTFYNSERTRDIQLGPDWVCGSLDESVAEISHIHSSMNELQTPEWIYGQTPQFILSSHPVQEDERDRPSLPAWFPSGARIYMKVRSGVIDTTRISISEDEATAASQADHFHDRLKGLKVHELDDFHSVLRPNTDIDGHMVSHLCHWLNDMFAKRPAVQEVS